MKKRFLYIALALALVLSACGAPSPAPGGNGDQALAPAEAQEPDAPALGEPDIPSGQDAPSLSTGQGWEAETPADSPGGSAGRPSTAGPLAVDGTHLVGEDGEAVQLRGVSTHGLAWFPEYVNADLFRELSGAWGVNAVRLAMYTAEYGGYCTGGDQEALRQLVCDGVRYAADADLYAIVDWHILSDGDPNTYKSQALSFFGTVSAELAPYDNVLYEICNEPNGGTSWERIKSYAQEVIPVIRANDPDAVILVGTPNWSQDVDQAAADPITEYDNLMYTLHFYAATHKDGLRAKLTSALEAGLPVFVSEYGICDASGSGAVDAGEANLWADLMDQWGVSYLMWSLCNKDESASILDSSCRKVSGFAESDLAASGRWLWGRLAGAASGGPDSGASSRDSSSDAPAPGAVSAPADGASGSEGSIQWTLELTNSWESGGAQFRQYSLTIQNTGAEAVSTWSVTLDLGDVFELQDAWNGQYGVSGTALTVTPMDYNSSIPRGGSVSDIGFILRF